MFSHMYFYQHYFVSILCISCYNLGIYSVFGDMKIQINLLRNFAQEINTRQGRPRGWFFFSPIYLAQTLFFRQNAFIWPRQMSGPDNYLKNMHLICLSQTNNWIFFLVQKYVYFSFEGYLSGLFYFWLPSTSPYCVTYLWALVSCASVGRSVAHSIKIF